MLGILSDFFIRRKIRIGAATKYSSEIVGLFSALQVKFSPAPRSPCFGQSEAVPNQWSWNPDIVKSVLQRSQ
jgi:hypothetical protein